MLAHRLSRISNLIQRGGKVHLLRVAKELVPVVLKRPVIAKIGLAGASASFFASADAHAVCMEVEDDIDAIMRELIGEHAGAPAAAPDEDGDEDSNEESEDPEEPEEEEPEHPVSLV